MSVRQKRIVELDERVSVHTRAFELGILEHDPKRREQAATTFASELGSILQGMTRGERHSDTMTEALQSFSKGARKLLEDRVIEPLYVIDMCRQLQEQETFLFRLLRSVQSDKTGLLELRKYAEQLRVDGRLREERLGIDRGASV